MSARDASTPGDDKPLQSGGHETSEVVIRGRVLGSLGELVIMLGGCLAFAVVGAWLVDTGRLWGIAVLLPAAVGVVLTMLMGLIPVELVRTNGVGVAVRGSLRPARTVAWANAHRFRAAPGGGRRIVYDYRGSEPVPGPGNPWFTPFVPGHIDLRGTRRDPSEVARAIEARRPTG